MRSTKAQPDRPGSADCPKCGRKDVTTRWEHGVELYDPHTRNGSTVTCYDRSNRPVVRP